MNDYSLLFKMMYLVISIIVSVFLLPWIKEFLKTKVDEAKYKKIIQIIDQAVKAFEEAYKKMGGMGAIKKEGVIQFANETLARYGITIDDNYLDKLIDAIVFEMNKDKDVGKK